LRQQYLILKQKFIDEFVEPSVRRREG